jgi:hypothetical protein
MAQTQHDYNELFYGVNGQPALIRDGSLTASLGALAAGTVLVLDPSTQKFVIFDSSSLAVVTASGTPDTKSTIDTTKIAGLAILLESLTVTTSVTAKVGLAGGIDSDKVVLGGSTITTLTEYVKAVLRMNNIFVRAASNAIAVAGE